MSNSILPSLHYVYRSNKSNSGFVIVSKKLSKLNPVWIAPELECKIWVARQQKQGHEPEVIVVTSEAKPSKNKPIDTATQMSYDGNQAKQNNSNKSKQHEANMNSELLKIHDEMQAEIARHNYIMNELLKKQIKLLAAQEQQSVATQPQTTEPVEQQSTTPVVIEVEAVEPSAEPVQVTSEETAPSNDEQPKPRRKVVSKKQQNVEAVAATIKESVCKFTRDEARHWINDNAKGLISGKLGTDNMNDAICAFQQGGIESVPEKYLTAAGKKAVANSTTTTRKGKKAVSKKDNSDVENKPSVAEAAEEIANTAADSRLAGIAAEVAAMNKRWSDVRM